MSRGAKITLKIVALVLVLAVAGVGVYQAYFYFLKRSYPLKYEEIVTEEAAKYDIEPALIYAIIKTESGFNPSAQSSAGAVGLMQLMPNTFSWLQTKVNDGEQMDKSRLTDPEVNITYGVYFVSLLKSVYENEQVILSAYNAGMGTVDNWLKDSALSDDGKTLKSIPWKQTNAYVDNVLSSRDMYRRLYFDNENGG